MPCITHDADLAFAVGLGWWIVNKAQMSVFPMRPRIFSTVFAPIFIVRVQVFFVRMDGPVVIIPAFLATKYDHFIRDQHDRNYVKL